MLRTVGLQGLPQIGVHVHDVGRGQQNLNPVDIEQDARAFVIGPTSVVDSINRADGLAEKVKCAIRQRVHPVIELLPRFISQSDFFVGHACACSVPSAPVSGVGDPLDPDIMRALSSPGPAALPSGPLPSLLNGHRARGFLGRRIRRRCWTPPQGTLRPTRFSGVVPAVVSEEARPQLPNGCCTHVFEQLVQLAHRRLDHGLGQRSCLRRLVPRRRRRRCGHRASRIRPGAA